MKPKLEDYNKAGGMLAPHGMPDYKAYSEALDEYIVKSEIVSGLDCDSVGHKMMLAGIYKECGDCGEKFKED